MGSFNFGSFAGGAAQGFQKSYEMFKEQERRDALLKLAQEKAGREATTFEQEQRLQSDIASITPEGGEKYVGGPVQAMVSQGAGPSQAAALQAQMENPFAEAPGGGRASGVGDASFAAEGTKATIGGLRGALAPEAAQPPTKKQTSYGAMADTSATLMKSGKYKEAFDMRDQANQHLELAGHRIADALEKGSMDPVTAVKRISALDSDIQDGYTSKVFQDPETKKWMVSRYNNETMVGEPPTEITPDTAKKFVQTGIRYANPKTRETDRRMQFDERKAEADIAHKGAQSEALNIETQTKQAWYDMGGPGLELDKTMAEIQKARQQGNHAAAEAGLAGLKSKILKLDYDNTVKYNTIQDEYHALNEQYQALTPDERSGATGKDMQKKLEAKARDVVLAQKKTSLGGAGSGGGAGGKAMLGQPGQVVMNPDGTTQGVIAEDGSVIPAGTDVKGWNKLVKDNPDISVTGIVPVKTKSGTGYVSPSAKDENGRPQVHSTWQEAVKAEFSVRAQGAKPGFTKQPGGVAAAIEGKTTGGPAAAAATESRINDLEQRLDAAKQRMATGRTLMPGELAGYRALQKEYDDALGTLNTMRPVGGVVMGVRP